MQIIHLILNDEVFDAEGQLEGFATVQFSSDHWKVQATNGWFTLEERKHPGRTPERVFIPSHRVREVAVRDQVQVEPAVMDDDEWVINTEHVQVSHADVDEAMAAVETDDVAP